MLGATLGDNIRNEDLCRRPGVKDVLSVEAKFKWNWVGYIAWMQYEQMRKRLLDWRLQAEK